MEFNLLSVIMAVVGLVIGGVAATVFQTLADAGIPTGMIATSEIRISTTVDNGDIEEAARAVHAAFNLGQA